MYLREPLAHDLPLVEVVFYRSDLLIGLVPLAAEDDDVARFRLAQSKADGLAPVLDDGERRSALQNGGEHISQDGVRVFGARIVARENNEVRERRGDAAHAGSLRPVTVAPAAKERDDAPIGKAADRRENIFEPVGRVRIVNDDGERCIKRYDLAPPLNADTFRQRLRRVGKRHTERLHSGDDAVFVGGIRTGGSSISGLPAGSLSLGTSDGGVYLSISPSGIDIKGNVTITGDLTVTGGVVNLN